MATTSSTSVSPAGQAWHHAVKVRKHLLKQLDRGRPDGSREVDFAHFEKVDSLLETMRLACVQTIFLDFEYATEEKTEHVLWTLHTSVNSEYRRVLGKLKGNSHIVEKRKVEKMYHNFLRIAQKFYKAYVQRLTARYDIPELKRIANGIAVEQHNAEDMISPVLGKLNRLVLRSCHATLIRLGDLARYRVQAKDKRSGGYDSALTYYALAHDLLPESGFGHHQMGIIQLEDGTQLDAVYHLYRAWAAAEPHPNAKGNLEAKFKDLREPNMPAPRQVSATPRDTFSMWFIKLHAFFYKGESFSQHAELEGEVIHRLEMIAKGAETGEMLLKTILINIAAFHVAESQYANAHDDSALHYARFVLGINARFISTTCDLLGNELAKHAQARQADADFENGQLPPVLSQLLPMLRVHIIWLASRRKEIFSAPEAMGGSILAMLRSLARVLTLLCSEATKHSGLASSNHLLWEDLEIRGIQPLEYDQVPEACRSYCDASGRVKPRPEPQSGSTSKHAEALARMLDILRIAYFLAEDRSVPLACRVENEALLFEYQPNLSPAVVQHNGTEVEAPVKIYEAAEATPHHLQEDPGTSIAQPTTGNAAVPMHISSEWSDFSNSEDVTNQHTENTVMSMLTPFLRPPTPQTAGQPSVLTESSYGLHSASAEEAFDELQTKRSPGGTVRTKTFEQLPWNWLHTPTPQKGDKDQRDMLTGRSSNTDDTFGLRSRNGNLDDPMQSPLGHRTPSAAQQSHPTGALRSPLAAATDDAHRNQLLQSLTGNSSAPRTSSFSHWSPDHDIARSRQASATSPWGPVPPSAAPMSSNMSTFSHPSSLYQGTPGDAVSRHHAQGNPTGHPTSTGPPASPSWQTGAPSERQLQVDSTTSSYDAAIFEAAFRS